MFAQEKGADYLATGHYASIEFTNNKIYLKESNNKLKDQSYFLSLTDKEHLKYIKCPLSNINDKKETRELAKRFGLSNFQVKDSQDICFIKNNDYISFIKNNTDNKKILNKPGNIVLKHRNTIIKQHKGLIKYTVGQRRGLGIPYSEPLYVTNIDSNNNAVIVGTRQDLIVKTFKVSQFNWLLEATNSKFECFAKVRAGAMKYKSIVTIHDTENIIVNLLEDNITAICPGQVCVLYNENSVVIGAGIIKRYK